MDATYFDPIEVPDSTELESRRTLFITPNGDRAIRLKSQYRGVNWPAPAEVVIDLTPAAIVRALSQIPGFTISYERPLPAVPQLVGAVVLSEQVPIIRVEIQPGDAEQPWRSSIPITIGTSNHTQSWFTDHEIAERIAAGAKVLSEGVAL